MAPEMAYDNRRVDGPADIYALGCVAYWLLTGQLVFEGDTPMGTVLRHAKDVPQPPSARTELEIPANLERVILACLEKEPEKRPQSARELSQLFSECERSLTRWTEERALHWWETHLPHIAHPTVPKTQIARDSPV